MRPTTLIALTALLGLSACDASKMGAPLGSKTASSASNSACPTTPTPACPPATTEGKTMTMEPEGSTSAATSGAASAGAATSRSASVARANWASPPRVHRTSHVAHRATRHRAEPSRRVHRNVYAGGYTGETSYHGSSDYDRDDDRRGPRVYVSPDVRYGHQDNGYDDRDSTNYTYHHTNPPAHVAPRMEEHRYVETRRYVAPPVYVAPRPQVYVETHRYDPPAPPPVMVERHVYREVAPTYRAPAPVYQPPAYHPPVHREEYQARSYQPSSSTYVHPPVRRAVIEDDCQCQTEAAGRDRQGFLTWPGKR